MPDIRVRATLRHCTARSKLLPTYHYLRCLVLPTIHSRTLLANKPWVLLGNRIAFFTARTTVVKMFRYLTIALERDTFSMKKIFIYHRKMEETIQDLNYALDHLPTPSPNRVIIAVQCMRRDLMEFRMSWMFLLTMEDHFENRKAALRNGVRVCEMEMMKKYYARHAAVQVREAGQQMPSGPVGGESSASQIRRSDPLDGSAEQAPGEGVVTEDTEVAKGDDTGSAEMDKGKVAKGKEVVRGDATGSPETSKGKEVARGNDTAFRSAGKGKEVARGNDPRSPSTGKGTEVDRGNDPRSPLAGKGKEVDRGDDDGSAETDQVKKEDIEEEGSQSQRQDVVTFEERMKPCKATYESDDELPRK